MILFSDCMSHTLTILDDMFFGRFVQFGHWHLLLFRGFVGDEVDSIIFELPLFRFEFAASSNGTSFSTPNIFLSST